jgi:hypothetical protein
LTYHYALGSKSKKSHSKRSHSSNKEIKKKGRILGVALVITINCVDKPVKRLESNNGNKTTKSISKKGIDFNPKVDKKQASAKKDDKSEYSDARSESKA